MIDFETVTFGGSGLNRVAHLRADAEALKSACAKHGSYAVVFWRGKPLVDAGPEATAHQLVRLPLNHPIFQNAPAPILLGKEDAGLCLAYDISNWQPVGQDLPDESFLDQTFQRHPELDQNHGFQELRAVMARLSARDAELAATGRSLFAWHRSHQFCSACGARAQVVQSGWQSSCPSCGTQHFPRTDPVVIMLITHGNSVLLGRSPGWPEGMYSLLAGFVEPGETPEAAVRREVFEEAGVTVGQVGYLGSQPWAFPSSLMMGFRGEAKDPTIQIDPVEIEDALWVSREELTVAFAGDHEKIKPTRKGSIAHFILLNWLADKLD